MSNLRKKLTFLLRGLGLVPEAPTTPTYEQLVVVRSLLNTVHDLQSALTTHMTLGGTSDNWPYKSVEFMHQGVTWITMFHPVGAEVVLRIYSASGTPNPVAQLPIVEALRVMLQGAPYRARNLRDTGLLIGLKCEINGAHSAMTEPPTAASS